MICVTFWLFLNDTSYKLVSLLRVKGYRFSGHKEQITYVQTEVKSKHIGMVVSSWSMGLSASPLLMPLLYAGNILAYEFPRELLKDSYLQLTRKHLTHESGSAEVLRDILLHHKSSKLKAWRREAHNSLQKILRIPSEEYHWKYFQSFGFLQNPS